MSLYVGPRLLFKNQKVTVELGIFACNNKNCPKVQEEIFGSTLYCSLCGRKLKTIPIKKTMPLDEYLNEWGSDLPLFFWGLANDMLMVHLPSNKNNEYPHIDYKDHNYPNCRINLLDQNTIINSFKKDVEIFTNLLNKLKVTYAFDFVAMDVDH